VPTHRIGDLLRDVVTEFEVDAFHPHTRSISLVRAAVADHVLVSLPRGTIRSATTHSPGATPSRLTPGPPDRLLLDDTVRLAESDCRRAPLVLPHPATALRW
jgi:hypothetical protein